MVVWKPAKGYEKELKSSNHCGVKTAKNVRIATTVEGDDIVFTYNKKKMSAITLANNTFGEEYVHIPQ